MKQITTILFLALFSMAVAAQNPKAQEQATVVCGNARFTVLTDRLVRMEWSEDGAFEDRASLAIINRELPVPQYDVRKKDSGVQIRTSALTLDYKGGRFAPENLSVSFRMNGRTVTWNPAMKPE